MCTCIRTHVLVLLGQRGKMYRIGLSDAERMRRELLKIFSTESFSCALYVFGHVRAEVNILNSQKLRHTVEVLMS